MIEISVNGEKKSLQKEINIQEMIDQFGYEDKSFAVAVNGTFVPLKLYETTKIKAKDTVDILAPMVGG